MPSIFLRMRYLIFLLLKFYVSSSFFLLKLFRPGSACSSFTGFDPELFACKPYTLAFVNVRFTQ